MKIFAILWAVVFALLAIVVVLLAFRMAVTPFETIVIGALAIIYASVDLMHRISLIENSEREDRSIALFLELMKTLKNQNSDYFSELAHKGRERRTSQFVWQYLYMSGDTIIYIISIIQIFRVVL